MLFLNNPDVADDAIPDQTPGYAGHFTVFAHGDCWGDPGHCDPHSQPLHAFDRRPPHPLTPINITVEITGALQALRNVEEVTVTALAYITQPDKREDVLRVRLPLASDAIHTGVAARTAIDVNWAGSPEKRGLSQLERGRVLRRFPAVALQLGVLVALFVVSVTGVAEARTTKRLALGQLDAVSATWSITVTDCPYCLGGGQVDIASGSLTSRHVQVDVRDQRGRPVDTYGHPLPVAGALSLVGGQPNINPLPRCDGPDLREINGPANSYALNVLFTRAADQLELGWTLPSCDGQIDGTPAQATPARASIPLSMLKQSRYSIRFADTVPFDLVPDPSEGTEHWRGTISYDVTLRFAHRCIRQGNGTRFCV